MKKALNYILVALLSLLGGVGVLGATTYSVTKLDNRINIGIKGDYTTLKEAVDWFDANATKDYDILLDTGDHEITDTITVSSTHSLVIRGLGQGVTRLVAGTGLTNKPMFDLRSKADINRMTVSGATLADYGTLTTESFVNFTQNGTNYSEITDIFVDTFYRGIYDTAGVEFFLYNFVFSDMNTGVEVSHSNPLSARTDIEVGNFENNGIGIYLATSTNDQFIIRNIIFENASTSIGIKYDGEAFGYGEFAEIIGCSYNSTGTMFSGFDFTRTDGRDANIVGLSNVGDEDWKPHAKLNVVDNVSTTIVTTAGTYYKVEIATGTYYSQKITVDLNKATYQPSYSRDGTIYVSGNLSAGAVNRNVNVGIMKNGTGTIISPFTVRTITANQPYGFSLIAYIEDIEKDDFFEIWLTSSNNGDVITVQDLNAFLDTR